MNIFGIILFIIAYGIITFFFGYIKGENQTRREYDVKLEDSYQDGFIKGACLTEEQRLELFPELPETVWVNIEAKLEEKKKENKAQQFLETFEKFLDDDNNNGETE